jgi:hypothetical protein
MKNNRKNLRKYIGESYQTCHRSYLFLLVYFDEFNLIIKIDLDVFNALIFFFGIFKYGKVHLCTGTQSLFRPYGL